MTSLKVAITVAVIAACAIALNHYVALPLSCNIHIRVATRRIEATISTGASTLRTASVARRSLEQMQSCVRAQPGNVAAQMVLAANYRFLGRLQDAAAAYETALLYDRRPELYLNLGETQLAIGNSRAALNNLTLACIYNPSYINEIAQFQPDVKKAVDEYQLRLMQSQGRSESQRSPQ